MAYRYITAPEVFARHAASGLTKYTYDEVVTADAECSAAEADLDAAVKEALNGPLATIVDAIRQDWTAEFHLDETHPALVKLWRATCSDQIPGSAHQSRGGGEMFPVKTWLGIAAKTRRYAERIRREIARLTARVA